jgi:4-alpha-glucanotransferase
VTGKSPLEGLAEEWGIQLGYHDMNGQWVVPEPEALTATLRALGADPEGVGGIDARLDELHRRYWERPIEPVVVLWDGKASDVLIRIPADRTEELRIDLQLEEGGVETFHLDPASMSENDSSHVGGRLISERSFSLPQLPHGYHRMRLSGAVSGESLILAAPTVCHTPPKASRQWGLFAPMYGIHSATSWGGGNFTDFQALTDWVEKLGGNLVATLPLLAAFLGEPFEPSPYAPASRLFWNEVFLDVMSIPELAEHAQARELIASQDFQDRLGKVRQSELVDYRGWMQLVREVVELLAGQFFQSPPPDRWEEFQRFLADNPLLEDYAAFRATDELQKRRWHQWPASWRSGALPDDAYDPDVKRYHMYVQWITSQQLERLSSRTGLYLDFPLGVHNDGYDAWSERDIFVQGVAVGAPPDALFTGGQNWGFSPPHPERQRESGYHYLIQSIRHQLRRARILRIDHVMALHRLFWIPPGHEARDGVYVRYRDDELFAILTIESRRHDSIIIGEDLGTVPEPVREAMDRHGVRRMFVLQYEVSADGEKPIHTVPPRSVASVNTHDMPTFASYITALDVELNVKLGLLNEEEASATRAAREAIRTRLASFVHEEGLAESPATVSTELLEGLLAFLAGSEAEIVIISLEDLWGETSPQNVPGTSTERPNWRRRLARPLMEIIGSEPMERLLRKVDTLRGNA